MHLYGCEHLNITYTPKHNNNLFSFYLIFFTKPGNVKFSYGYFVMYNVKADT